MSVAIHQGDNLDVLASLRDASVDLVYIDPPFNTGGRQTRVTQVNTLDPEAHRVGFGGKTFRREIIGSLSYQDRFPDYLAFLGPRLREAARVLRPTGALFVHLDYREVHYVKVWLDELLGRDRFMNELIWAYDYGARSQRRWSCKHDTILWYVMDPENYTFRYEDMERIPYMAPKLVGEEKAERGKTPTDTWWHTIVSPTGKEKTGYPTQKPLGVVRRIVQIHAHPGDTVLDFFAGSGTTGEAAALLDRHAILVDSNPEAIQVMTRRLAQWAPSLTVWPTREEKPAALPET